MADICTSGDDLHMFENNSLDFIVAKHNLEHYHDPVKTVKEWKRVLKPNGKLGIIVPDHDEVDTFALDRTHTVSFNMESLKALLTEKVGGFNILHLSKCIPKWSIIVIAEKL